MTEHEALLNAAMWLACEVDVHSTDCTCGSCGAVAESVEFVPEGEPRDRAMRIKTRFDKAMKKLARRKALNL